MYTQKMMDCTNVRCTTTCIRAYSDIVNCDHIKEVYQFNKLLTTDMNNEGSYVDYFEYMSSSTSITIKTCS